MRVITGTARGRKLKEPVGMDIRPTTDMVKEALFNIIQFDIEGRRVLDLFAGTGQLGIEALSRGAKSAVFVDESSAAIRIVRENVEMAGFSKQARIIQGESLGFLRAGEQFDLIFLDPPYQTNLLEKALKKATEFDILSEGGIMVCESKADKEMPELAPPYQKQREYRYGKTKISLYTKIPSEE